MLPGAIDVNPAEAINRGATLKEVIEAFEKQILTFFWESEKNPTFLAATFGITRQGMNRKLIKYGIKQHRTPKESREIRALSALQLRESVLKALPSSRVERADVLLCELRKILLESCRGEARAALVRGKDT